MLGTDVVKMAREFIITNPLAVIGTTDVDHKPWGAAVYVGCDSELNLYFTTKGDTAKHRNLIVNPTVSVVIVDEKQQITFQAQGQAKAITDAETGTVAASILRRINIKSEDWMPPITKINAGSYEIYKVQLTYAKLRMFGDKRKGEKPWALEYKPYTPEVV